MIFGGNFATGLPNALKPSRASHNLRKPNFSDPNVENLYAHIEIVVTLIVVKFVLFENSFSNITRCHGEK